MRISDCSSDVCSSDMHRAAHAVADRPHAVDAGVAVFVDLDHAALVELHAGAIGQQAAARGAAADRDQQLVERDRLLAVLVGVGDDHFLLLALAGDFGRSEEHTSELQSLMRNSYAVFCLKKKTHK